MDRLTRQEANRLAALQTFPSVSFYLPTTVAGREVEGDRLRLKNLVTQAEHELVQLGLREPEARTFLEPVRALLADHDFWRHQSGGLAVLLSREAFLRYPLQAAPAARVVVGDRFHTLPLYKEEDARTSFHLLAVSAEHVRLLRRDPLGVAPLHPEGLPAGLEDVTRFTEVGKDKSFHQRSATSAGNPTSSVGGGYEEEEPAMREYCRLIDRAVGQALNGQRNLPLVFAGVEKLFALYREENHHPHLLDAYVSGNPDRRRDEELAAQAEALIAPLREQRFQLDVERFRNRIGADQGLTDLPAVLKAATEGRVDVLFVAEDVATWGRFEPATQAVEVHPERQAGDVELVDQACAQTQLHKGTVHIVTHDRLPDGNAAGGVVAGLRY